MSGFIKWFLQNKNFAVSTLSLLALLVVVDLDAITSMVSLWLTTDTYMHGVFVLPLVLMMASQMPTANIKSHPLSLKSNIFIMLMWSFGFIIAKLSLINVLMQFSVLSFIPVMVLMQYGWKRAWYYKTPLILLFLAIPVGDFLIPELQTITANMSVFMLRLSGVTVLHNGWYITIPNASFRVAEACSGINFLISTFVVSIFYSFMYFNGVFKRSIFIVLGFVVPVITNSVRVYLIVMVAHWGDVESATGFDHVIYGWVFFTVILAVLFFIGYLMSDNTNEHQHETKINEVITLNKTNSPKKALVVSCFFTLISASFLLILGKSPIEQPQKIVGKELNKQLNASFPHADKISITENNQGVLHYIVTYYHETSTKKMISFENNLFDQNIWSIKDKREVVLTDGVPTMLLVLTSLNGDTLYLYQRYLVNNAWQTGKIQVKYQQIKAKLTNSDWGGQNHLWLSSIKLNRLR